MRATITGLMALTLTGLAPLAAAMDMDATRFSQVKIDQLELRDADDGTVAAWDVQAWYGGDLNKVHFYSEGERLLDSGGTTESRESRLAWGHAIAPFWDAQLSVRRDWQPDTPNRDWVGIGVQGLAPYFFETSVNLFAGESGLSHLRLEVEYDLLLTQRLILSPELEINLYGKEDRDNGIGAGLTGVEGGLRLRYEIRREFAPYIGLHWERQYGDTADYTRAAGHDPRSTSVVAGVRAWF